MLASICKRNYSQEALNDMNVVLDVARFNSIIGPVNLDYCNETI